MGLASLTTNQRWTAQSLIKVVFRPIVERLPMGYFPTLHFADYAKYFALGKPINRGSTVQRVLWDALCGHYPTLENTKPECHH